jgi:sulfur transfer protein SufE
MKKKCIRYQCKTITCQGICDKHQQERIAEGLEPYVEVEDNYEYLIFLAETLKECAEDSQ